MSISSTYASLPTHFFESVRPTPVRAPRLLVWNEELASSLDFDWGPDRSEETLAAYFSGNELLAGSQPIALAYAGHQFGHFVPELGDGRAHLLGEWIDGTGQRRDLQLKGSGRTRFSRGGDGRCALGPALREFIMGEAMHGLRIPTTRGLAVVATGEPVFREQPSPGAIVTRVASSHIRVGTFEYFAARGDTAAVRALSDYTISRHFPSLLEAEPDDAKARYAAFFDAVVARQIELIVHWMRVGFIHGVMNTDNTALSGETIDYGPCAMMSSYDPGTVFSSIDRHGRYAFGNQPAIAGWNMARLAECLLPLIDDDADRAVAVLGPMVERFAERFEAAWLEMMRRKLGLTEVSSNDLVLVHDLLRRMREAHLDYTRTFDRLRQTLADEQASRSASLALEADPLRGPATPSISRDLANEWVAWKQRIDNQPGGATGAASLMAECNPRVIPRNHHVEAILSEVVESQGSAESMRNLMRFVAVLRSPYEASDAAVDYQDAPADGDRGYRTFCGT